MKNKLHSFISILLTLIFVVGLMPLTSIPAAAKSNIPVVMTTANGDMVEWSSKVGSNDGYWEIYAENDDYHVLICSGVTDHEAGSYTWSDLQGDLCGLTVKSTSTDVAFTNCSDCTVTVNGTVINVSGIFTGDNGEYYAVDITYGTPAVTEWHVGDTFNIGGKYCINDDTESSVHLIFDLDKTVPTPTYDEVYDQWRFDSVLAFDASNIYSLWFSLPDGKTASDVPIGFKVKSGDGTLASPYEFELVYAAAAGTEKSETIATKSNTVAGTHFTISNNGDYVDPDGMGATKGITVSPKNTEYITKVVITVGYGSVSDGNTSVSSGEKAIEGSTITVTNVNASTFTLTCNVDGQFKQFVVYYLDSSPAAPGAYADYLPAATDDATALAAKVVKFNGHDWYLIEDNSTSETDGTVTLFAKDTIGSSRFNNSNNVYSGSMVKSYLDNLTAEGGAFADVSDAIVPTDLEDVTVTGAKLWLLSKDEVITTYKLSTTLNKCSNDWWLRTPATSSYVIFVNGESGSVDNVGNSCMNTYGVRPALNLDLSKVEFDSETKTFAVPAAPVEYPLWIGGVQVTSANAMDTTAHPTWSYAADTNTLTLNGYTNSGTARADIQSGVNNAAIYYNDNMSSPNPLTIQLAEGTTNSLTMTGDRVYGIYVFGSALTITGNGTLNIQSEEMAINDAWGIAITGGTVNAASGEYYGINSVTIGADISSVTVTGKLGAIYGGSNEEQALINAVAGTGWTDTAGTTGEADIAISTTGQNVSSYKKVQFPAAVTKYPLWIGDTQVTSENMEDTEGTRGWSFTPADDTNPATLTLNGITVSTYSGEGNDTYGIFWGDTAALNIVLTADTENTVSPTGAVYGIFSKGAVTISGTGTLTAAGKKSSGATGIEAKGLTISGGNVNINGAYGIYCQGYTVTISGGALTATGYLGAVRGTVKNAIAGTGWTDTAGTTGEADIDISTTGQSISSYNKVQFPAVEPAPLPEGLWVGETEVTDTVTSGKGWSYDAETNTLTLNGYSYSGYGHKFSKTMNSGLYYKGTTPLNIVLEGRSLIILGDEWVSGSGYNYRSVGIYAEGGVKFSGTGYLSVSGSLGGIIGDATVDGCELYISADSIDKGGCAGVTNLTVNSGKVTVNGGDTLSGGCVGGYAVETLTVNGGIVYVYGGNAYNSSSAVPQSAVKTLTVNGGVLYAKSGYSSYGSYSIPAVAATADGGSITVGKDVKVYGDDIQSSYDYDMPTTETEKTNGDYARNSYMIFEGPSAKVTVPYKDHEWKDGALVTTDKEMTCNTVTFAMGTEWSGNYYADHNVTLGSEKEPVNITLTGDTNIVLSDTAMLYVYGTVDCGDYTLNIYGNEMGGGYSKVAFHSGAFTVNNTSEKALALKASTLNIHGGTVEVKSTGEYNDTLFVVEADEFSVYAGSLEVRSSGEKGLSAIASASTNVYGGSLNVFGGQSSEENVEGGTGFMGSLCVYGGYVNAYGGDAYGDGAYGGNGIIGNVEVYGGQVSTSGGYSSAADGGVAMLGRLTVYGGTFDADGGYDSQSKRNYAISGTVTLGEGVAYFEGEKYDLFAEGPVEEMESGTAGYAQIKGGVKYVYVDQTTGAVTTAYAYDAESRINSWLWSKWYIVEKDTTINDAVYFDTDEVNIIIADGVTLTFANGLNVPEGKTLKIYAQSMDEATMGTLIATGANGSAGIGGENGGNVYIYSGNVEATGDTGAAGIDGIVYIYGGKVTATGGEGSVGINGDLTLGDGVTLYGDDDVNPPTTVIEEESGNYHRAQYMKTVSGPATATISGTPTAATNLTYTGSAQALITADPTVTGGTVKYSTDQQNWYTRENFKVTAAGTYNVYYYVAGDDNHDDSEVFGGTTFTVTVDPKEITVTADEKTKTYGDADPALTYAVEGLVAGDEFTGALTRAAGENVGTYAITQGTLAASDNYSISFTGATLTIDAKAITVTADSKTKTYGSEDPELTYTVDGLAAGDALTGALARAEGENVGTYAIMQGTLAAGDNYTVSFTGSTLTVEKKTVSVTAEGKSKIVGEKDPELTYRAEGLVAGDTLTGALARAEGETEGKYAITQGTLAAGDNYELVFYEGTLTIRSAGTKVVKVVATAATKTYGDKDPVFAYTVEGLAEGDTLTGALARAEGENVGTYAIAVGTLTAGDKYVIEFTGATLTVTAKEITVKANAVTKTFGSKDPALTYTAEGLVSGDTLTGALARAEGEAVGTYAITQGTLAASENYTLKFEGAEFTIAAMIINVTADDQRKVVGAADPELTYKIEGIEEAVIITGALAREAGETEGTYAITQGTLAVGGNYAIRFTGATLTIYEPHVETDVNIDEDAPDMEVEGINEEVANTFLTEEEKEALENGEEVKIYLEVIAVDEEIVPSEDKTEIEKEAEKSGMKVGMYLDMSLLKKVGSSDAVAIHDTEGNMVKVTVTVPENLRNTNPNVKRTFYVVRVHDGKTEVLGQSTSDTVSFETDKFSTYSLTYKDDDSTEETKSGSLTWLWIVLAVVVVAAAGVAVFFIIKKKNGGKPTSGTDKTEEPKEPEKTEE